MRLPIRRSQYGWYLFGFTIVRPEWEYRLTRAGNTEHYRRYTFLGRLVIRRQPGGPTLGG
jgi:hypothetical protein